MGKGGENVYARKPGSRKETGAERAKEERILTVGHLVLTLYEGQTRDWQEQSATSSVHAAEVSQDQWTVMVALCNPHPKARASLHFQPQNQCQFCWPAQCVLNTFINILYLLLCSIHLPYYAVLDLGSHDSVQGCSTSRWLWFQRRSRRRSRLPARGKGLAPRLEQQATAV